MIGLLAIGILIALIGSIWFLVVAFKESFGCGLLCMFVPFYSLYYTFSRWKTTKIPFFVSLAGCAIVIIGAQ